MNTDFIPFRYEPAQRETKAIAKNEDDRMLIAKQFHEDKIIGSFFSCIHKGATHAEG